MNIFGIGLPEMAVIFVLALLVFGPKKLPEIGRSVGKALRGFQDASREFQEEFKKEAEQIEKTVTQVNQTMKAELEPPQPKAIAPTGSPTATTVAAAEPSTPADSPASEASENVDAPVNAIAQTPPPEAVVEPAEAEDAVDAGDAVDSGDSDIVTPTVEDPVESSTQA